MYTLSLTAGELTALSWIGHRYDHGTVLRNLLYSCEHDETPEETTFYIPEHVAWQIGDLGAENEYSWDCLSPELATKLTGFCFDVV